jgi:DNA invertase Pin-like site-specific DNA recombinase
MTDEEISAERRKQLREWGRAGGKKGGPIGGRRKMAQMTAWERKVAAHEAGLAGGGAPRKIDHAKVRELRERGLLYREIAEALEISMPSVARILRGKK